MTLSICQIWQTCQMLNIRQKELCFLKWEAISKTTQNDLSLDELHVSRRFHDSNLQSIINYTLRTRKLQRDNFVGRFRDRVPTPSHHRDVPGYGRGYNAIFSVVSCG